MLHIDDLGRPALGAVVALAVKQCVVQPDRDDGTEAFGSSMRTCPNSTTASITVRQSRSKCTTSATERPFRPTCTVTHRAAHHGRRSPESTLPACRSVSSGTSVGPVRDSARNCACLSRAGRRRVVPGRRFTPPGRRWMVPVPGGEARAMPDPTGRRVHAAPRRGSRTAGGCSCRAHRRRPSWRRG